MGSMPSTESDLVIVSLVRYADSCEPESRHGDCPFAVESQGKLTCHEECRGVIKSLLRRGRGEPTNRSQAFDARQLRLSERPGAPDILWHTSSLMQIVVQAARSTPFRRDGSIALRRLVEATSALGALGSRGLEPEHIIRFGAAKSVKLALAVWLGRKPDGRLSDWKYLPQWEAIFEESAASLDSVEGYISSVLDGPVARKLDSWIATASINDILMWNPPNIDIEPRASRSDMHDAEEDAIEAWTWMVDRFTQTYLDRWSLSSLKYEYAYVKGELNPDFSSLILAERVVAREDVTTALADRAMVSGDAIDPAMMDSFTEQALSLLREGQRTAAAALFKVACTIKPKDLTAQNNYAFCILLDNPEEAKSLLADVLERGVADPVVSWCNLALAERLLGNVNDALKACEQAYKAKSSYGSHLWVQRDGDWVVEHVGPQLWAARFGAELESSIEGSTNLWASRVEELTPNWRREASSDPSSGGTDEEDL